MWVLDPALLLRPSCLYRPVPSGSSSWDMEIRIPSWKGEAPVRFLPPRWEIGLGRRDRVESTHPLLLGLHFLLQHLRHVAHSQNHVVHSYLVERTESANRRA